MSLVSRSGANIHTHDQKLSFINIDLLCERKCTCVTCGNLTDVLQARAPVFQPPRYEFTGDVYLIFLTFQNSFLYCPIFIASFERTLVFSLFQIFTKNMESNSFIMILLRNFIFHVTT